MSEAPQGPGWWYASDGRWYPPPYPMEGPAGIDDVMPSTPPTPVPDHPPLHMGDDASGQPDHVIALPPSRNRSKALWAVSAVALILAIAVIALALALVGRGPTNFRTASQQYDVVVTDVLDAEDVNLTFVDTFWQTYSEFAARWTSAAPERRPEIVAQFLEDLDAEIAQFRSDLAVVDGSLVSRAFDQGTDADRIRDAAVAHYRSWREWAAAVPTEARAWTATTPTNSLDEWIDARRPELNDRINESFHEVCAELSDSQPSDGSYEDVIFEICSGS